MLLVNFLIIVKCLVSEDNEGALLEILGSLLVDVLLDLNPNRLKLFVNKIFRPAWRARLVTELTHENELLKDAEVGTLSTSARTGIVYDVRKEVVIIFSSHFF